MQMRQAFGNMRENLRRYGFTAAAHDVGCRAMNKVVDLRVLRAMVVRLQDVPDLRFFDAQGLNARFVGEDELARFVAAGTHDLSAEFLREARARGDRCYALFDGETLAAYGWYASMPTPVDRHFELHFDRRYTYMYKGYTATAYRGRRLHAAGMCRALRAFTEEGRKGLISWVYSNNFASLQSVVRMGYRTFGNVYLMCAGAHSFAHATRGCSAYGFRVEPLLTEGALNPVGA
ncbi:MAG: hypothetical protein ACREU5_10665 [Burkholderiales bacterium]